MDRIIISLPEKVKRQEPFRGSCSIALDNEVPCRNVSARLECVITYPNPCVKNFGENWSQHFLIESGIQSGKLKRSSFDFEFALPEGAPPTYAGKRISCKWFVRVKVDVPMTFDISQSKEIRVER